MNIAVLWDVAPYSLAEDTEFSEEHAVSIFTAENTPLLL
jgi:hypothetical protein